MKFFLIFIFMTFNLLSFEEKFKKEIPAKGIESVFVENTNGDIEIYGEEDNLISIEATKKAEKENYLKNLNINIKKEGKILFISAEHIRSYLLGFLPVKMGGSVKYKINLPQNIDLKVETTNGNIFIENVKGHINSKSVNGDLNLKEISGLGAFETVNGDIKIEFMEEAPDLKVESVNGNIYLKSYKKLNAKYSIEVINGKIKIVPEVFEIKSPAPKEINGKWGDGKGKVNLETINGNVTIEFEEGKKI